MSQVPDKINGASEHKEGHLANSMSFRRSSAQNLKGDAIRQACLDRDIDRLIRLTETSGGLLDDSLRQAACKHCMPLVISSSTNADEKGPILLGCEQPLSTADTSDTSWKALPRHRDEDQVQLDVNRAFVYYPNGNVFVSLPPPNNADPRIDETEKEINTKKAKLFDLIVQVLRQHPMLCYFQGYHDIVQVLLLVLGERAASVAVARISLLRIRDYMLPSLSPALKHLQVLPAILERADPHLAAHLASTRPFFALAATLTLYAHDIQEYSDIARLFDFILAHEPVMAIYTFAAIIISRRSELLGIPVDEPEMLHFTLSKLPQPLDLEELISSTLGLFQRHPPEHLPRFTWWKICSNSVLKTSRSLDDKQSLEHGEALFHSQARRLQREELQQKVLVLAWKYRWSAGSVAAAVLVGAASLWLRRSGQDKFIWNFLWKAQGMLGFKTSS